MSDDDRLVRAPTVIWRSVAGGVLVRRWDSDDSPVVLNDPAWRVLEQFAVDAPGGSVLEARDGLVRSGVPAPDVGDLGPVVEQLVAVGLLVRVA